MKFLSSFIGRAKLCALGQRGQGKCDGPSTRAKAQDSRARPNNLETRLVRRHWTPVGADPIEQWMDGWIYVQNSWPGYKKLRLIFLTLTETLLTRVLSSAISLKGLGI